MAVPDNILDGLCARDRYWAANPANRTPASDERMSVDLSLEGRMERRLPIIMVVHLAHTEGKGADANHIEKTYTDNISLHGARVFSRSSWEPGQIVRVAPLNHDCVCGKVVYCQRLEDDRHAVGLNFQGGAIGWSILERYGGA